jgi:hypothetical protein
MKKPTKIVAGELQRDPAWSDAEYSMRLDHHRAQQRLGTAVLLMMASGDLLREEVKDAVSADELRRLIAIVDEVERIVGKTSPDLVAARKQAIEILGGDYAD